MLNMHEVSALFERESILIGQRDAVPEYKVIELFGIDAAKYVRRLKAAVYWSVWSSVPYVTRMGFNEAATYNNISEVEKIIA
ncbi:hypothetical protein LJB89_01630 [Tyzzerella sp. OttesenSCG-928-J15]|nr:hypothetical protein [Tyzzerella sp. OttesenSCG-928-J15]